MKPLQRDAALEPLPHLAHIVFEALERLDAPFVDNHAIAQQSHSRTANGAIGHIATRYLSHLWNVEDLTHLNMTCDDFAFGGVKESQHRCPNLFLDLIDYGMEPNINVLYFSDLARSRLGTNVETDDDRHAVHVF